MDEVEPGWAETGHTRMRSANFVEQRMMSTHAVSHMRMPLIDMYHLIAFFRWSRRITMGINSIEGA